MTDNAVSAPSALDTAFPSAPTPEEVGIGENVDSLPLASWIEDFELVY